MHSHQKNESLSNLLDRIANGTMPKIVMERVLIKQIFKIQDMENVNRIILKWDKKL